MNGNNGPEWVVANPGAEPTLLDREKKSRNLQIRLLYRYWLRPAGLAGYAPEGGHARTSLIKTAFGFFTQ
jgi:hypothetical protein